MRRTIGCALLSLSLCGCPGKPDYTHKINWTAQDTPALEDQLQFLQSLQAKLKPLDPTAFPLALKYPGGTELRLVPGALEYGVAKGSAIGLYLPSHLEGMLPSPVDSTGATISFASAPMPAGFLVQVPPPGITFMSCDPAIQPALAKAYQTAISKGMSCLHDGDSLLASDFVVAANLSPIVIECDPNLLDDKGTQICGSANFDEPTVMGESPTDLKIKINPDKHDGGPPGPGNNCGSLESTFFHELLHAFLPNHSPLPPDAMDQQVWNCESWCINDDASAKACCFNPVDNCKLPDGVYATGSLLGGTSLTFDSSTPDNYCMGTNNTSNERGMEWTDCDWDIRKNPDGTLSSHRKCNEYHYDELTTVSHSQFSSLGGCPNNTCTTIHDHFLQEADLNCDETDSSPDDGLVGFPRCDLTGVFVYDQDESTMPCQGTATSSHSSSPVQRVIYGPSFLIDPKKSGFQGQLDIPSLPCPDPGTSCGTGNLWGVFKWRIRR